MKKLYSLFGLLLISAAAMAGPVSQEQAAAKARAFLTSKPSGKGGQKLAPARTSLSAAEGQADGFFVFNVGEGEGFVLVSGDDRTPAILGYTDRGSFDAAMLPPHVRAWLASYSDQIRALGNGEQAPRKVVVKKALNPLLQTTWNQDSPYNKACPVFVTGEMCSTGCVATAMAQVMKYYEWPAATRYEIPGYKKSYRINDEVRDVVVEPIPAGLKLDWANMLNAYTGGESEEQATAVALLMRAAGASVEMEYKDDYNGGSGAANARIPGALQKYFNYSMTTEFVQRKNYTIQEWNELVYAEIQAGRPVVMGGSSTGGGHAFVVDGYSSDDLFHVNWGWGGYCDGYFLLSVVNPGSSQGAGASKTSDGYSMDQNAIIGIKPNRGEIYHATPMQGEIVQVEGTNVVCNFYSLLDGIHTFEYGFGYVRDDGTLEAFMQGTPVEMERNSGRSLEFPLSTLPEGHYVMVPICRVQGETGWHTFVDPKRNYVDAVSVGGEVTLTLVAPKVDLALAGIMPLTTPLAGRELQLNLAIHNKGDEYYGPLYLFLSDTPGTATLAGQVGVTVPAGLVSNFTFYVTPATAAVYTVYVSTDEKLQNLIGYETLVVNENTSVSNDEAIQVLSATFDNAEEQVVYGFLRGRVVVKNVSENPYVGGLDVYLLASSERYSSYGTRTMIHLDAEIPAGETLELPFETQTMKKEDYYWPFVFSSQTSLELYRDATGDNIAQLMPGVIVRKANGTAAILKPAADIQVDQNAVAVELTGVAGVTSVTGGNPNTLYFLAEEDPLPAGLTNVVRGNVAENIVLQDGYDFVSPFNFIAKKISFTRNFIPRLKATGQGWETIVLPFDVTSVQSDLKEVDYALGEFADEQGQTVIFRQADEFAAANPYLIGFPAKEGSESEIAVTFSGTEALISPSFEPVLTGGNFKMQGANRQLMIDGILTLNDEGTEFIKADGKVDVFRCYFKTSATAPASYTFARINAEDCVDGIHAVENEKPVSNGWFTLDGRRIQRPAKAGIYVIGGKKVIMK